MKVKYVLWSGVSLAMINFLLSIVMVVCYASHILITHAFFMTFLSFGILSCIVIVIGFILYINNIMHDLYHGGL